MGRYGVANRQACRCVRLHRSMYFYRSRMDPLTALRQRMRELAHARVRFGYRRIYMLLRREGWDVGKDRFYRVYCEENLGLRRKRPWRHVSAVHRILKLPAGRPNEVWGMDFSMVRSTWATPFFGPGDNVSRLSIRPHFERRSWRSGHQGKSHTSGPISVEASKCAGSPDGFSDVTNHRYRLDLINLVRCWTGHRSSSSGRCVVENCFLLPQQSPRDPYKFVSQCTYRDVRMHAGSETSDPPVQRVVSFVLPYPQRSCPLDKESAKI